MKYPLPNRKATTSKIGRGGNGFVFTIYHGKKQYAVKQVTIVTTVHALVLLLHTSVNVLLESIMCTTVNIVIIMILFVNRLCIDLMK